MLFGYLAIWLISLPVSQNAKTSMIPYFDKLISYSAIWLISLSDSKKQSSTLLLYYEMLFGYLANWSVLNWDLGIFLRPCQFAR